MSQSGQIRVALAQINPTVGDLKKNADLVSKHAFDAANAGAVIVVYPEMILTGYPVEDLANRASFREASIAAVSELATRINNEGNGDLTLLVGYLGQTQGGKPQNCVAVIYRGEIVATYIKHHLPNYGVFDEYRNFTPGAHSLVIRVCGVDIGIAICEDIWQSGGPVAELAKRDIGLLLVPNGSPYEINKNDARLILVKQRAIEVGAPLAYVNMTGGQDDLVFDGDTIVVSSSGELIARAPQFEDGLMVIDLDVKLASSDPDLIISAAPTLKYKKIVPGVARRLGDLEQIWQGLVIGLRDYVGKNNFKSVILGISGGIDSALVAALAADAIGADKVHGIALPSKYSSEHSLSDAKELASNIGLNYRIIQITPMVANLIENLRVDGLAEENLQARVRGLTLMALSNQEGHLVLATGNKSELAVGYSTMYGDAVGGFAPIKDLYKTQVWQLATWRNELAMLQGQTPPIPENSIKKEPSAELAPNQKDSDSLPEYKLLDQILSIYIDEDGGRAAALAAGFDPLLVDKVVGLVDRAEYKRRQYPPGTKISARAFGKDRRLPITSHWRES
ncbi:NAD+ synthase (glutamine-hydrolysing) [Candidatus Nanopelagicus abundans]|uniref:Glutamine-dependent NAD(+) synthetase n=1 Tax=Candidatus Nanopelagicus abundans TaxID=1884916 RepID=A0A249L3T7_9ACTN|nr:NAD+ synthase [Candidatus Nanopelagicus abundans]ASY23605.1 NAD+ synthase (glutamine-hydrolysing) [Candidatus Nanopelagicus abundans]